MIHPILLDARPDYMAGHDDTSLLLTPVGRQRLVAFVEALAGDPGWQRPSVLTTFTPTPAYIERLSASVRAGTVAHVADLCRVASVEPSDWLLFFDVRHLFLDPAPLETMLHDIVRSRLRATHLVTMAQHRGGTSEWLDCDADGRVRRVQRYYDTATWPFLNGVACSLVPAAAMRAGIAPREFTSLADLRAWLAGRGVPCRDVRLEGPVFDLRREAELLRLSERLVVDAGDPLSETAAALESGAHTVGPVVIHPGATIERGATIIGPSVVGAGARVGADAVVAQCVLSDGAVVPARATVRGRALFGEAQAEPAAAVHGVPTPVDGESDLHVHVPITRPLYPDVKAVAEALLAGATLLALSPLLALIALLIKLDSRGPVFFRDIREGRGGRLFPCLKFRTMRLGSEVEQLALMKRNEVDGPQFKLEKDPRLTRLGRWLRPASLDELPQLINVMRGEMSLIGPRPSPFRENQTCVPWRSARLTVRPGITGLWQVCRHDRRDGDFHQWIYFDLLYVQHMSFLVDLKILLATVFTRGGQTNVPVHWIIPARRLS